MDPSERRQKREKFFFHFALAEIGKIQMEIAKQKHTKWRLKNITHPTVKKSLSVGGFFHLLATHSTQLSGKKQVLHFVALLLSISHFQGVTLDEHKFWCSFSLGHIRSEKLFIGFVGSEPSEMTPGTCTLWYYWDYSIIKKRKRWVRTGRKDVRSFTLTRSSLDTPL